ncbi:MAG: DUF4268 domain-containing protein [Immundisolibacterales bacterium]|nr:DUF4268 domain-containing protein [Immundisolibacterales bacterium]
MEGIGTLSPVDVRTVWADEARDFTPWLAENADLLGEALGLDLRHEQTEAAVGRYSADLVFREGSTDRLVVVENLFGPSDHDHLGKLIVYAAGLEAGYAVLLAPEFRDEHRAALDWLNSISAEDFGFFGIVLEAWRIGDSLAAPRLRVEVKPNNWSRSVQAARSTGLTVTQQAYLRFWGEFLPAFRDAHPGWTRATAPQKVSWMNFPSVRSALLTYSASFCRTPRGYGLRAEAYIDTGDRETTKEAFDALREKQGQIEHAVGDDLEWERRDPRQASRISLYFPTGIRVTDEERWLEARDWLVQAMGKMRAAFDPVLEELRA